MLITILIKNNSMFVIGRNSVSMLRLPRNDPNNSLFIDMFLLSISETLVKRRKSNAKFNNNTKSTYTFILSPDNSIKKTTIIMCRFIS